MERSEEIKADNSQAVEQSASCNSALGESRSERDHEPMKFRGERRRQERQARKAMRGFGTVFRTWWRDKRTGEKRYSPRCTIKYIYKKKLIRELTPFTKESDAWKLLKKRHGEIALGKPVGPDLERTTFEDMAAMVTNDYKANGRKSLARLEDVIGHLREYFGDFRAVEITGDTATAYVTHRQAQSAANSTINNELSAVSRMLVLGIRSGKVATKPHIAKLATRNARKGFFEYNDFKAVLSHLPDDIKPIVEVAYLTGWRIDSEILTRQRHHVDLNAGWLRLDPNESKNSEGRMFPLTPRLREVLEKQIAKTEELQKELGRIIPHLFHRNGVPIKMFRRSWITACKKAGVPGKIRHDFRRTACRNLERAGVERSTAIKAIGHLTESIYRRYSIVDESMLSRILEMAKQWQSKGVFMERRRSAADITG